jgi:hypothetical protein
VLDAGTVSGDGHAPGEKHPRRQILDFGQVISGVNRLLVIVCRGVHQNEISFAMPFIPFAPLRRMYHP